MPHLYLIRHAESTANAGGISQPNADIPLSAKGRGQARQLAGRLTVTPGKIITSAFLRTRQTAQPWLDKLDMHAESEALLNEFTMLGYSLVKGLDGEGRKARAIDYRRRATPDLRMGADGETFREFLGRVEYFLDTLPARQHDSVLFTHGIFIRLTVWRLLGMPADTPEAIRAFHHFAYPVPNCAVFRLHWQQNRDDAGIRFLHAAD